MIKLVVACDQNDRLLWKLTSNPFQAFHPLVNVASQHDRVGFDGRQRNLAELKMQIAQDTQTHHATVTPDQPRDNAQSPCGASKQISTKFRRWSRQGQFPPVPSKARQSSRPRHGSAFSLASAVNGSGIRAPVVAHPLLDHRVAKRDGIAQGFQVLSIRS